MAYSNWGGYAYRNGIRVAGRSDAQVASDNTIWSSPGCWSGFAQMTDGVSMAQIIDNDERPGGHVVLGQGPIWVCMYKLNTHVYRGHDRLEEFDLWNDFERPDKTWNVDGHTIVYRATEFTVTGQQYPEPASTLHVRQPDGTHWHGFVAQAVGAGFEVKYAADTRRAERAMKRAHAAQWRYWGPC